MLIEIISFIEALGATCTSLKGCFSVLVPILGVVV